MLSNILEPEITSISTLSAVEAKGSEVLQGTEATISCVVKGLTKKLDGVKWEKPNSGGVIASDNSDGYKIEEGTYNSGDNSQTTILTVPKTINTVDASYTCVIQSVDHGKTEESSHRDAVQSNVFSEFLFLELFKFCLS